MLNGVGGRTIEEAKQRMSYAEAVQWEGYRRQRGSLHWGRRIEISIALLAALFVKSKGGRGDMEPFMPHEREEPAEASIHDVMAIIGGRNGK